MNIAILYIQTGKRFLFFILFFIYIFRLAGALYDNMNIAILVLPIIRGTFQPPSSVEIKCV